MSRDEAFLVQLIAALAAVGLEAIVVGTTAAALQGAPIMTQDVDLLVRDTPQNREKLRALARQLAASIVQPNPASPELMLVGADLPVDIVFDALPGGLTFASLRSRAVVHRMGDRDACVASLTDVVRSKEAADRPKDRAQLPVLRQALEVRCHVDSPSEPPSPADG